MSVTSSNKPGIIRMCLPMLHETKKSIKCVTCVTMYPYSGISYEKIVQKKDPGNGMQCDASDAMCRRIRTYRNQNSIQKNDAYDLVMEKSVWQKS